jgi:alanine racemase
MSTSVIEISGEALIKNVEFIKRLTNDTQISAVVKGNAYGHGIERIVPICEKAGIRSFSVFSSDEAKRVYKVKQEESIIYIMGFVHPDDFEWIINNNIQFSIYDLSILRNALQVTDTKDGILRIHLDVETGMNRTGLSKEDLKIAVSIIKAHESKIKLVGVSTHLAGAESVANYLRIRKQLQVFRRRIKYVESKALYPEFKHCACSAGFVNYPESIMDMIRVGIFLYGYWPTRETYIGYITKHRLRTDPLMRVIKWKTKVMNTRFIREGEFIGYGLAYQAQTEMHIAIIPVGYSDGYSRQLSNNGHVLIHGQRADVIGLVNMNMTIIDISNIENVNNGDEVVLIGKQKNMEISFGSFAEMNNNLNYELLSRLSENTRRITI